MSAMGPAGFVDVYKRQGQYCINIYDRDFEKLNGQGALRPVSGDIEDFYELVSEELYTEEMLSLIHI